MKGLVGGASQGSADCLRNWTTAPARLAGMGTHPTCVECAEAARIAWGGGRYKLARKQGRSKTGIASLPHVKLSPMSAPRPTVDGRNTWMPSSPSQELARGGPCSGVLTFSRTSGARETCRMTSKTLTPGALRPWPSSTNSSTMYG